MAIVTRQVCKCNVCKREWLPRKPGSIPGRCPFRSCRSTGWNGWKENSSKWEDEKVIERLTGDLKTLVRLAGT